MTSLLSNATTIDIDNGPVRTDLRRLCWPSTAGNGFNSNIDGLIHLGFVLIRHIGPGPSCTKALKAIFHAKLALTN